MDTVIEVMRRQSVETATGARSDTYSSMGKINAERASVRPSVHEEAGEIYSDVHAEYNVRIYIDVREGDRVREDRSSAVYEVTHVLYNRRKAMQTLVCDRVNQ